MILRQTIPYKIEIFKRVSSGHTDNKIIGFEFRFIEFIHGTFDNEQTFNSLKSLNEYLTGEYCKPYEIKPISAKRRNLKNFVNSGTLFNQYQPNKSPMFKEVTLLKAEQNIIDSFLK